MHSADIFHLRAFYTSREHSPLRFPALLLSWMLFTSVCGAFIMGFLMDGILRNVLDSKEHELLSSRHLTVSTAYRDAGLPGVVRLLRYESFRQDYILLTDASGKILLKQNPDHVRFTRPLTPMPTIGGESTVCDWQETVTDHGLDYDLLSGRLPGGATLRMGINERPQEKFFRRSEKITAQAGGSFIVLGLLGATILIYQFQKKDQS